MGNSKEQFEQTVENFQNSADWRQPMAFGICRVDRARSNAERVLQATYGLINWKENFKSAAILMASLKASGARLDISGSEFIADVNVGFIDEALRHFSPFIDESVGDSHKNVQVLLQLAEIDKERGIAAGEYRVVFLFADDKPLSVEAVYMKLYALSTGRAPLRSLNLNGAFGVLPNIAWSGNQPIDLEWLRQNEIKLKLRGEYPRIDFVDKFPRYLQHVIPADNVRVLDGSRVRMGAHLAAGTTIMPGASYVNFNAGTTGPCMVEGRISSSAVVGANSDVGGGASILGVLSGTDGKPITIGQNTLLGANSVTGIPLGDGCIVDAGIAILAGTKITITKAAAQEIARVNPGFSVGSEAVQVVKAGDLSGLHGIHFRVNSQNGQMQAIRSTREVKLNAELH